MDCRLKCEGFKIGSGEEAEFSKEHMAHWDVSRAVRCDSHFELIYDTIDVISN